LYEPFRLFRFQRSAPFWRQCKRANILPNRAESTNATVHWIRSVLPKLQMIANSSKVKQHLRNREDARERL
jgi:hypothetical protein